MLTWQDLEGTEASWLRKKRVSAGMSAKAFAAAAGVSRITLWRWETGRLVAPAWVRIVAEHIVGGARQ